MTGCDVALVGTTASGKSALALAIAESRGDFEIVSVDSMQVYRGMDIGTATPTEDERSRVPHHMIDIVDPGDTFELSSFAERARAVVDDIHSRGRRAMFTGGTGLYFQAVVDAFKLPGVHPDVRATLETIDDTAALFARLGELDPQAATRIEPGNRRRIIRALEVCIGTGRAFSSFGPGMNTFPDNDVAIIGTWLPRSVNAARIERRIEEMLDKGWLDEVAGLGRLSRTAAQALGYRQLGQVVAGEKSLDDARVEIGSATRAFSRRQRMWFRRDRRIEWFATGHDPGALLEPVLQHLEEIR